MKTVDGIETVHRLRKVNQKICTVFVTGVKKLFFKNSFVTEDIILLFIIITCLSDFSLLYLLLADRTELERGRIKEAAAQTQMQLDIYKSKQDLYTKQSKRIHDHKNQLLTILFTAYGVLVNQVGVCASYSAAFKLLADAAGLDSIVVTGYLEGNLPHAWNKVSVDGQWNIVDATNNDNEVIQNALFNLSDSAAYATLVEDDRFVLDNYLYDFEALSDDKEYCRITDNYYPMDEITDMLAEKLQSEGNAALRTDYELDDETFNLVAQEAADLAQANIAGFHWMGLIHLELR